MDADRGVSLKQFLSGLPAYASLNACVTLGYDAGLFQILAETEHPLTSQRLSENADVKERYLKEWLRAMVNAKIISCKHEESANVYYLTDEQREALTDASVKGMTYGLGGLTLMIGQRHTDFLKCFRKDGPRGLTWNQTPSVFSYMEKFPSLPGPGLVEKLITKPAPSLHEKLESGASFADIGCGSGFLTMAVAQRYPDSTVVGVDISDEALHKAREECERQGIKNCKFINCNTEHLPEDWEKSLDGIVVCLMFHGLAHATEVLKEWKRVLKDDGVLLILDENVAVNPQTRDELNDNLVCSTIGMYFCISNGMQVVTEGEPIGPVHDTRDAKKMMESEFNVDVILEDNALYICKKK